MKAILLFCELCLTASLFGQQLLPVMETAEELAGTESNSSSLNLLGEDLEYLLNHPVNLNSASEDELSATRLFLPFQLFSLLEYREKYGPFFTVQELAVLPGFRKEDVLALQPFLICSSVTERDTKKYPSISRHELCWTSEARFPLSSGYTATGEDSLPAFAGSPVKLSLRYRADLGQHWKLGLAVEKDPGEILFKGLKPQFTTAFLNYKGEGLLREAVVGSFRVRTGLGLANGVATGQGSLFRLNGFRAGEIKPYASMNENNFSSGLALRCAKDKWEALTWVSSRSRDLTTGSMELNQAEPDLFKCLNETGLHRTASEEKGRGLVKTFALGLQLSRRSAHLTSAVCMQTSLASLAAGTDSLIGLPDSLQTCSTTLSLFNLWFTNRFIVFTEFACTPASGTALLGGLQYQPGSFIRLSILGRAYSKGYRAPEAEAFSLGGSTSNEQGIYAEIQLFPLKYTSLSLLRDYAHFPSERYLCKLPSYGSRTLLQLSFTPPGAFSFFVRYQEREKTETIADIKTGVDPLHLEVKKALRADGKLCLNPQLSWNFRFEYSWLNQSSPSVLAYQQLSYEGKLGWRLLFRHTIFQADDWDNRIYCYEPGVRYSFSFPAYYGRGSRTSCVLKFVPAKKATIYLRLSRISYTDRMESGTGNDLVSGEKRLEGSLQFILKL